MNRLLTKTFRLVDWSRFNIFYWLWISKTNDTNWKQILPERCSLYSVQGQFGNISWLMRKWENPELQNI